MVITRFAPSPTGADIHAGNLRMAVLNHHYARSNEGLFVLRIEDTMNDRLVPECTAAIQYTMERMLMSPDRVLYQAERKPYHLETAEKLITQGKAYYKDGAVWMPGGESSYVDKNFGNIKGAYDDFVIVRSNGEPSFMFANILDDIDLMKEGELTVIRGEDHKENTLKQIGICGALGVEPPCYWHMPLVLGMDGKPLSKRGEAGTAGKLLDMGIHPCCLYKYLLGVGNGKAAVHMDLKKLLCMNREYMTCGYVINEIPECEKVFPFIQKHIRCLKDVENFSYLWKAPLKGRCEGLVEYLDREHPVDDWWPSTGLEKREAYELARKALCGTQYSLDLNLVIKLIGKEEAERRLV